MHGMIRSVCLGVLAILNSVISVERTPVIGYAWGIRFLIVVFPSLALLPFLCCGVCCVCLHF